MKQKKIDWISRIAIAVMLMCLIGGITIYYNEIQRECINDPFVFGAKMYEEKYGEKLYGYFYFLTETSPVWLFNSENITMKE